MKDEEKCEVIIKANKRKLSMKDEENKRLKGNKEKMEEENRRLKWEGCTCGGENVKDEDSNGDEEMDTASTASGGVPWFWFNTRLPQGQQIRINVSQSNRSPPLLPPQRQAPLGRRRGPVWLAWGR